MVSFNRLSLLNYLSASAYAVGFIIQFKQDYQFSEFISTYYKIDDAKITAQSVNNLNLGLKSFEIGPTFRGVIGDFNAEVMKHLYYNKNIASISLDRDLTLAEVQENAPKHLTRLSQISKLDEAQHLDYLFDASGGIGVDVFVLDSGIQADNPEFTERVTKLADFTGEDEHLADTNDYVGHGTYIAGVIGSQTYGVAKKCNLFDVRVTNSEGKTKLSSIINAFNTISVDSEITGRPSLAVVPLVMKKNAILNSAVESLVKSGIPVITPAGNDGKQACNYSPASAKGALTVGAIDAETDSISSFSNWGACVDIFAPGVKVETTNNTPNGEKVVKSGTSLSTGIAAGLVAYFMGMGDSGLKAVERVMEYSLDDLIPEEQLELRPLTSNKILFNGEGEPNWGQSP